VKGGLPRPARDAQLILGHSRLAVTQEIYTHEDRQAQHDALTKISKALRDDRQMAQRIVVNVSTVGVNHHLPILTGDVLPGGAKRARTADPLLAKYAQTVGYRR
jgi:hypothetical protein